jgi:endonuclease III
MARPLVPLIPVIIDKLERFYGPLPQPPSDPFGLYVWEVMSLHTTGPRRDAAINALRRIPALTPDSMGRVSRAKLEAAVALAGPYREERIRALLNGVDAFRRHRDLPERLRADRATATEALKFLPHLTSVSGQWMLLLAGGHTRLPEDPHLMRVLSRLGTGIEAAEQEFGAVLSALQRGALYLSHHGRATCVEADPFCHLCPLKPECPYAHEAASHG